MLLPNFEDSFCIVNMLFPGLIKFNVSSQEFFSFGIRLGELWESFVVHEADLMAVGVGQDEDPDGGLPGGVQVQQWSEDLLVGFLHPPVDLRLLVFRDGKGNASVRLCMIHNFAYK